MPSLTNAELHPSLCVTSPIMSYFDDIVGAAIFDLNGLPKEYFTTPDNGNMSWVQTIFQALGLRSLLTSSLQLEGFRHATIYGTEYSAIVVKQKAHYTALLVKPQTQIISKDFVEWAQNFEFNTLRTDPRFQAA